MKSVYNGAALEIEKKAGIPVNDLRALNRILQRVRVSVSVRNSR